MTMILAVLLSFQAHAGWFGPSDSDKERVVIEALPPGTCKSGSWGFSFKNPTPYQVDRIDFYIMGKEEGHSTAYDITDAAPEIIDEILKPGESTKYCVDLTKMRWPNNKTLKILPKMANVVFHGGSL